METDAARAPEYICISVGEKAFLFPHTDIHTQIEGISTERLGGADLFVTSPTRQPPAHRSRGTSSCGASCCSSG